MSDSIKDNVNAINNSFLYYLHEEDTFDKRSYMDLCKCIEELDSHNTIILKQLYFIQNQVLRHVIYHFDPQDQSKIFNFPNDYWAYIEILDMAINKYENQV